MKSIFRATAILSGSSVLSIFLSLLSAKVMALYLQPSGYGYYGLLLSFVGLASLLTGMGIPTGLVRLGAGPASRDDKQAIANLRGGAWLLFLGLGCLTVLLTTLLRHQVSQLSLGTPSGGTTIVWMTVAVLLTVAANLQVGILNAYHCVSALAKYGVLNTLLGAAVSISCILIWRINGVIPGVIGATLVSAAVSSLFLHREVGRVSAHLSLRDAARAASKLLRFGGPFTASQLVGTGVQLALPMVVLHLLSTESVGYYRAAVGISVGYLGFLITAMGQDYYPRLAAIADQPEALVKLINEQHRLVMILAVPMILGTLAVVPFLVPIVYSLKFGPTVEILEWQMIGDLFKFASWTMSFAILARCGSSAYFVSELAGGAVNIAATWFFVRWLGLPGLGISFLVSYIVYYAVVWVIIRREIPLTWTSSNKHMMLGAVAAALVIRILPSTRFAAWRTPFGLTLAVAAGVPSLFIIWREFVAQKDRQESPSPTALQKPETVETGAHS